MYANIKFQIYMSVKTVSYKKKFIFPHWRTCEHTTGSAVALDCHKARAKINRKIGNSTTSPPRKIVSHENIILKLCIRDYVGEMTNHVNFGFNQYSGGFSPNVQNITTLWLFWLSLPFFSILRPGRTVRPIFTLYGSNDVIPRTDGPFRG